MGDRPSVRISSLAHQQNHGNAMSNLMGGDTDRQSSDSGTSRPPGSSCSSSWRTMHNNNQRGVRGVAPSPGMDSERSMASTRPDLKLDMQRVAASRGKSVGNQSPLPCPRSHANSPTDNSPVKSPAEKIKESRIPTGASKIPKPTSRTTSRSKGSAQTKSSDKSDKSGKRKTKSSTKPPQLPSAQQSVRGAVSEAAGGIGLVPGSVSDGATTKRGTVHKSKSSGVIIHKPQISSAPITLHQPSTPAPKPSAITAVASIGTAAAQGCGIPGLDSVNWKVSG